jgi:hypothetical protein
MAVFDTRNMHPHSAMFLMKENTSVGESNFQTASGHCISAQCVMSHSKFAPTIALVS